MIEMDLSQVLRERESPGRHFPDREERDAIEAEMSSADRARGLLHLVPVRSHGGLPEVLEGERNQGSLICLTHQIHHQCSNLRL